jgi:hypothetical protein
MSNAVFVVKNQHGLYLSKQQEWVDGTDSQSLYRTRHRDEAINTVFEVSSRDIYLRAESVVCELDAKGNPALATAEKPTSTPRATAELEETDSDEESAPVIEIEEDSLPEESPADSGEPANQDNLELQASSDLHDSPELNDTLEPNDSPKPQDDLEHPEQF